MATTYFVARRFRSPADRAAVALGIVAGALAPDLDLVPASLSFAVTFTTETGKLIHRTLTHSFVACGVLAVVGATMQAIAPGNPRRRAWGLGIVAAALSDAFLHVTPDLFYLVDVKCFFPLTLEGYFFGPFRLDRFTDAQNNVINGVDFGSETLTWLGTAALARRFGTTTGLIRWLPRLALLNLLYFGFVTVIFASRLDYDTFLIVLYGPGLANIVLSAGILPYAARETWKRLGRGSEPAPLADG